MEKKSKVTSDKYKQLRRKFISKTRKSREFLNIARKTSQEELKDNVHNLIRNPAPQEILVLLKDIVGSTAWITNAYVNHVVSILKFIDNTELEDFNIPKRKHIVKQVSQNNKIDTEKITNLEIFQSIFQDLKRSIEVESYETPFEVKSTNITIVLVSGVLNEIFKSAAFEHGTQDICKEFNMKYFVANVKGTKGVKCNANILKYQLADYIKRYPKEKLWIVAYSKGGIDSLHFLRHNAEFANKHILGLSTIATPILGSNRPDHQFFQMLMRLQKVAKNHLFTKNKEQRELFAVNLQESLSSKIQKQWFLNNYSKLPEKLFYTALGLNASWHESHVGMIFTKMFFFSSYLNDGIVDTIQTQFPPYFKAHNLGIIKGHHLIGYRSSSFPEMALLLAHMIYLQYKKEI